MKLFKVGFSAAALVALTAMNLQAEEPKTVTPLSGPTNTAPVSGVQAVAPSAPSALTFEPAIGVGMRSWLSGNARSPQSNQIGAYTQPAFELGYKSPTASLGLAYTLEVFGGRGYGDSGSPQLSNNMHFIHNPTLTLAGGISPDWKFEAVLDTIIRTYNSDQTQNNYEIAFIPEIAKKINSSVTVSVGYRLNRFVNFDAAGAPTSLDKLSTAENNAKAKAATDPKAATADRAALIGGGEPTVTGHLGLARIRVKFTENTKLNTYIQAGKNIFTNQTSGAIARDQYTTRLNADLTTKLTAKVPLSLRYRFNANINKGGNNDLTYYNLVRVVTGYEINDNWSINASNEGLIQQTTANKAAYLENESYLGTTFKF